jgi:hypothetical protein
MKGTGLTPHDQSHTVKGVRQHAKAVGASIWPRKDITLQPSAPNFLATGRETHYVFGTEHRRAIPTPSERLKWADEETSIPLQCHYAELVSLKMLR